MIFLEGVTEVGIYSAIADAERLEGNLWELVLSSHCTGPWDCTRVERCNGKYLYPLRYFTSSV